MSIINSSADIVSGPVAAGLPGAGGRRSPLRTAVERFTRSRPFLVGAGTLVAFILAGIIGPHFINDPNALIGPQLAGPSGRFLLGTTQTGQDVFAQLVASIGSTLEIGFVAGAIATATAIVIGIGGGYVGGVVDDLLTLFTNVNLVIPSLPIVIIIASYVRTDSLWPTLLIIAFTSWAGVARMLRNQTLSVRTRDYVTASRVGGEKLWRIVLSEILPNELAVIFSTFIYAVIFAILTQASLSFLGLERSSQLTWGTMLYFAQNDQALANGAWWWFVPPGLCIALVGTSLALMNFGLDEVLNPQLRTYQRKEA
jgi:peptide/nickel transport system permease protein